LVEGVPGVEYHGFVQPDALPATFADAGCVVVPSHSEAWGVVIHEAAASRLPIICTSACGASDDLVRNGYNGFVVKTGDAAALATAMKKLSELPRDARAEMGKASYALAGQFSPERWANVLWKRGTELARVLRQAA
jgi:glycosyltransferase involved in cell wall biosynthesis